jgi:hypothetical protein
MATAHIYLRDQVQGTNEQIQAIEKTLTDLQAAVEKTGAGWRGSVSVELDPATEPVPPEPEGRFKSAAKK